MNPIVESVEWGWSLMGHYYVTFFAVEGKQTRIECRDEAQARAIAEALRQANEEMSP